MTLERARLSQLPEHATMEEYDHAAGELEGLLRELPGLVAIYRSGSVSVPGISDLDRVAVVEDGVRLPSLWDRLSPRTKYLAMHTPFAVDRRTFTCHRWFSKLEPLELVWGERVEIEQPPVPGYGGLLFAAESLVVSALKLIKQEAIGRVKVRPFLCELNNLRRDLVLAGVDRADAPNAWTLADWIADLREAWWDLDPQERLVQIRAFLARARAAVDEALGALPIAASNRPQPLRLACEWSNVALVAANGRRGANGSVWLGIVPRRMAQRIWHLHPYEFAVPERVLALISGSDGAHDRFRNERRDIVRRHLAFAAQNARGYSRLGAAGAFLDG